MAVEQQMAKEIPHQLIKLARLTARMFYQIEHVIIIDVLVRHRCVKEDDLQELIFLDNKQLGQSLFYLKKDKMIKSVIKPETKEDGKIYRVSYHYFNYNFFGNVVKYKLDHMRKKIEAEEKQMSNRTSYICGTCGKTFTDLEVNRLLDHEGQLRCTHCSTILDEDVMDTSSNNLKMTIARFNSLVKPITDLLRQTENIILAPELLEPTPQSVLHLKKGYSQSGRGKALGEMWSTNKGIDLYGEESGVKVEIGDERTDEKTVSTKECPEWMQFSTVIGSPGHQSLPHQQLTTQPTDSTRDGTIIAELLAHERSKQPAPSLPGADNGESSDSDEDIIVPAGSVVDMNESSSESNSEPDSENHFSVTVGGQVYSLNEINDELIALMTEEEKQSYTTLCREAYDELF